VRLVNLDGKKVLTPFKGALSWEKLPPKDVHGARPLRKRVYKGRKKKRGPKKVTPMRKSSERHLLIPSTRRSCPFGDQGKPDRNVGTPSPKKGKLLQEKEMGHQNLLWVRHVVDNLILKS